MADTETLKLNPGEQRAFDEAHRTTTDFVKRIGQPGSLDVPVDQLMADDDNRVLVTSPRAFTLTLDDHRRVRFHAGINSVPVMSLGKPVAAHPYVKANGATVYNAPKTVTALGGSTLPDTVRVGDESIPVQQFITAAQLTSGLSIDAWNRLKPEIRDDMTARMIKTRQDTAMPKEAERNAPGMTRQDPFSDANYKPGEGNTAVVGAMPAGGPAFEQDRTNRPRELTDERGASFVDRDAPNNQGRAAVDAKAARAQQANDDVAMAQAAGVAAQQQRDRDAAKAARDAADAAAKKAADDEKNRADQTKK